MKGLYSVKAQIKESKGHRTIWQFNAIEARNKKDAILNCKSLMKKVVGTIGVYKWIAESEWENDQSVN